MALKHFVLAAAVLVAGHEYFGKSADRTAPVLEVREEPKRIVLAWSGEVAAPMRDTIAAAVSRFAADPRPLLLSLNSPGGSIMHGREVAADLHAAALKRPIDTLVDDHAVCASMCVPIFLSGGNRYAAITAHFMFHEATLALPATKDGKAANPDADAFLEILRSSATDALFERDLRAPGVDEAWLTEMRARISRGDVWASAQRLVDEGSGVVTQLVPVAGRRGAASRRSGLEGTERVCSYSEKKGNRKYGDSIPISRRSVVIS